VAHRDLNNMGNHGLDEQGSRILDGSNCEIISKYKSSSFSLLTFASLFPISSHP
jgi:hypothetical protein